MKNNSENRVLIFNIQKFSLHDGSGIRTLVFLKGCPLRCGWCSNPEGQSYLPELAFTEAKCIGIKECDRCRQVCRTGAIQESDNGKVTIDRKLCTDCGECVDACPARALELFGKYMQVNDVIRIVEEDSGFYARSGGGLTIGGGEPLSQAGLVAELLKRAQSRGIDTAIETSGYCEWNDLEMVCRHVNQVFFDIKSMDSEKHKSDTGVTNRLILENFQKLCNKFPKMSITVRTPVIPEFNDSAKDIGRIVDYLNGISGSAHYELLAYHKFGEPKFCQLGKTYRLSHLELPTKEHMNALKKIAARKIVAD